MKYNYVGIVKGYRFANSSDDYMRPEMKQLQEDKNCRGGGEGGAEPP